MSATHIAIGAAPVFIWNGGLSLVWSIALAVAAQAAFVAYRLRIGDRPRW